MVNVSIGLNDTLQQYLMDVSLREPEICRLLREQSLAMEEARMISSPEQVQLLALLCKLVPARNGIEIGTFTGYTSLRLTLEIPELCLVCCDTSELYTSIARDYWARAGVDERIDLRIAPAGDTLKGLLASDRRGTFDFVYIDADKTGYRGYVERSLDLIRTGGLIALDNTLWSGALTDPNDNSEDTRALRDLNTWLHTLAEHDLSLIPIGDGLTLLRKGSVLSFQHLPNSQSSM